MSKSNTVNVEVKTKAGEPAEKLIKRFLKKCKKADIVKEHLEKVSYFLTKSQKKKQKRIKNKFLRRKEEARMAKRH